MQSLRLGGVPEPQASSGRGLAEGTEWGRGRPGEGEVLSCNVSHPPRSYIGTLAPEPEQVTVWKPGLEGSDQSQ